MRAHDAHHGQLSPMLLESETHTDTQRVLAASPDGRLEEWISYVHRQIERIVWGKFLIIRERIHLRITMRRLLSPEPQETQYKATRLPSGDEVRERMLIDTFGHMHVRQLFPERSILHDSPRSLGPKSPEPDTKQASPLMLAA
jgi:hypothetical protein